MTWERNRAEKKPAAGEYEYRTDLIVNEGKRVRQQINKQLEPRGT